MALNNQVFTRAETAEMLGVTPGRVSQLRGIVTADGTECGQAFGNAVGFNDADISKLRSAMKPTGRPRNSPEKMALSRRAMASRKKSSSRT